VFKNRVLRRIFGPKRVDKVGVWRGLHNEGLQNLCTSSNIIRVIKLRRMRWARHVTWMGEIRNVYGILVGKPEGKRPVGRPRHVWEGNIRMDLREVGWAGVEWMHLANNRDEWWDLVNAVMNIQFS
jgi:hypothetical protein